MEILIKAYGGNFFSLFQPFVPDHFANLQRIIIVRILHLANEPYKCKPPLPHRANIAYFVILFVLSAIGPK